MAHLVDVTQIWLCPLGMLSRQLIITSNDQSIIAHTGPGFDNLQCDPQTQSKWWKSCVNLRKLFLSCRFRMGFKDSIIV